MEDLLYFHIKKALKRMGASNADIVLSTQGAILVLSWSNMISKKRSKKMAKKTKRLSTLLGAMLGAF
jgi:hypothetical protein